MTQLDDYVPIVGQAMVAELRLTAQRLRGKTIQNINSTTVGRSVEEILSRITPLLQQLGVDAHWDVIKGNDKFLPTHRLKRISAFEFYDGFTGDQARRIIVKFGSSLLPSPLRLIGRSGGKRTTTS